MPAPLMTPTLKDRLRTHVLPLLCLMLAPIIIGIIHDDWLYSPVGFPDPWFNVGYFLHYFDPNFLPGLYKEARVPWLVPGYFLYHVLGPVAANFVLHVGALIVSVVFVYLALARLITRNAAFIAAALLCAYYQFQGSGTGGWDYQTTAAGAFYALTLYLVVRAAQTEYAAFWLAGAGIAFGATVHANIVLVNLALGLAAIYLAAARHSPSIGRLGVSALWGLLGFILINLLFSVTAWDAGRDPLFFRSMFDLARNFTSDPQTFQQRWWQPWSNGWYMRPIYLAYLVPLAAVFIAGLAWFAGLVRDLRHGTIAADNGPGVAVPAVLVGQYVFAFGLWLAWQTQGQTALQPDYFAHPLIIPAVVALGAMMGPAGRREGLVLTGALMMVIIANTLLAKADVGVNAATTASWLVIAVMAAAIVVGAVLPQRRTTVILVAAAAYMIGYPAMAQTRVNRQALWSALPDAGQCIDPKAYFTETVRLNALLRRPAGGHAWLFDGPDETFKDGFCDVPVEYFRTTLLATGPEALGAFHATADELGDAELRQVGDGDTVAAVVKDPAQLDRLVARFMRAGIPLQKVSQSPVKLGHAMAIVAVYKVAAP
jgi:hypothetical protein